MKEILLAFLVWLKKTLAKESLFVLLAVLLAAVLSWITERFWLKYTTDYIEKLQELQITEERYRVYLVISFLLILYGIRFVESIIKTIVLSAMKKE